MKRIKEMAELEADGYVEKESHKHKESYSEELHGNIHEHCHNNLKKGIRI